jgi:hypothetical protein
MVHRLLIASQRESFCYPVPNVKRPKRRKPRYDGPKKAEKTSPKKAPQVPRQPPSGKRPSIQLGLDARLESFVTAVRYPCAWHVDLGFCSHMLLTLPPSPRATARRRRTTQHRQSPFLNPKPPPPWRPPPRRRSCRFPAAATYSSPACCPMSTTFPTSATSSAVSIPYPPPNYSSISLRLRFV